MPRPMTPQFEPDCLEPSNDGILIDMDPRRHKQHQLSLTYEEPSEERVQQILETARRINGTPKPAHYDEFTETALQDAVRHLRAYAAKIDANKPRAEMEEQIDNMLATGSSRELKDRAAQWIWTLQRLRCGRKIQAAWESAVWYRIAILEQTEGSK